METRLIIQVPTNPILKLAAEKTAKEQGFSSLQEAIRVFMTQLANKAVTVSFFPATPDEILTSQQEEALTKKYVRAKKEIAQEKGFNASSVSQMMQILRPKNGN